MNIVNVLKMINLASNIVCCISFLFILVYVSKLIILRKEYTCAEERKLCEKYNCDEERKTYENMICIGISICLICIIFSIILECNIGST